MSDKYYRDNQGFLYKKSGENQTTLYLDCLRQPSCISGARYYKKINEVVHLSVHSDEKPDDHLFFKIAFEEYLKKEVCKSENFNISALNLYKRAKNGQFKGIWLPTNHQSLFLTKLRRARNYEKKEKKIENRIQVKDVATSPIQSLILQRKTYSTPLQNNANATEEKQSSLFIISQRITYSTPSKNNTNATQEKKSSSTSPILIDMSGQEVRIHAKSFFCYCASQ